MSGPAEGVYHLRSVPIGADAGPGGMYATQPGEVHVEASTPVTVGAQVPSLIERQFWSIVRVGEDSNEYLIQDARPGTKHDGFHNVSLEDDEPVLFAKPKKLIIESVGDIPFGQDVYTIRPTEKLFGKDVYVGANGTVVVTKVFDIETPLEEHPGWRFYPTQFGK